MAVCFSYPPAGSEEKSEAWLQLIKLKEGKQKKVGKENIESKVKKHEQFKGSKEEHGRAALPSASSYDITANTNKRKRHTMSQSSNSSSIVITPTPTNRGCCSWHARELEFKNLLQRLDDDSDYSDWLYNNISAAASKRQRTTASDESSCISCSSSSEWWPRAQYLHQIDAYALPYVLPF